MLAKSLSLVLALAASANAHFRMQYPIPRGVFNAEDEINFCDNYVQVTTNRSEFPLTGGFFSLTSGHTDYTVGAIVSTVQNPTSFDQFNNASGGFQVVSEYNKVANNGSYCAPVNFASVPGIQDGSNVTIQIIYTGGDGNLYQCADLTVRANYAIPSDITCANSTSSGGHDHSSSASMSGSASASAPSSSSTSAPSSAVSAHGIMTITTLLAVVGAAAMAF